MDSRESRVRTGEHDHRRIERDAAHWLARRSDRGRPWTEADQAALDAWLGQSAAHQVAWLRLEMVWQRGDRLKALAAGTPRGEVPAKGDWRQSAYFRHGVPGNAVVSKVPIGDLVPAHRSPASHDLPIAQLKLRVRDDARGRSLRRHLVRMATAAAVVAMLVVGSGWWYYSAPEQLQLTSGLGTTSRMPLADGSQAILSSDTQLRVSLSRGARSIDLQRGEAFFEVVKDANRPFIVRVGDARVTAVGTSFAVRGGDSTRVVVTEGAVRLEAGIGVADAPRYSVLLTAGAVATIYNGSLRVDSGSIEDAEQVLSWRSGHVVLSRTLLSEAVAEFNRHNALRIVIVDPDIAQMQVDGSFRTNNVEGFVRLLEQAFPVRAVRYADRIDLHGR